MAQLKRSATVPQTFREKTRFAVIHWNGPSVRNAEDITVLKNDAIWHVDHNGWDGLAYHYGIGRTGKEYQCRLWNTKLPHSGNTLMNNEAFSILVITGDGDPISTEQYNSLYHRLSAIGIERRYWLGHQEAPRTTACPGALLMRWLWDKRNEVRQPASTELLYNANVRDEASQLSQLLGPLEKGRKVNGWWRLGKPVKGDSLWFELNGDRYIHASALNTNSYVSII